VIELAPRRARQALDEGLAVAALGAVRRDQQVARRAQPIFEGLQAG